MFLLAGDWWTLFKDTEGKDEKLATGIKIHASDLYAELLPNLTHPVDKELAKTRGAGSITMGGKKPPKGGKKLGNILINSDFEDELSGWVLRGEAVAIQSPKDAHSGNYFCQLKSRGYVGVEQHVTVSPGATLVLQMWIDFGFQGNDTSKFEVWSDRECVADGKFRVVKTVGRWRLVTSQVRLPQLLSKETLRVGVALWNPEGAAVRVDDCELTCTP